MSKLPSRYVEIWALGVGLIRAVEDQRARLELAMRAPSDTLFEVRTIEGTRMLVRVSAIVACQLSTPETRQTEALQQAELDDEGDATLEQAGHIAPEPGEEWKG